MMNERSRKWTKYEGRDVDQEGVISWEKLDGEKEGPDFMREDEMGI